MNRRTVLAGGMALTSMVAGCTYAAGGGDLHDAVSIPTPSQGTQEYMFETIGESSFVVGQSGMGWFRDEDGEMDFSVATTTSLVDRFGETTWRFRHGEPTEAMAIGDRAFLLQEAQLVASPPIDPQGMAGSGVETHHEAAWTVPVSSHEGMIAAVDETVAVVDGQSLIGYRDGAGIWETALDTPIQSIQHMHDGFALHTRGQLYWIDHDGTLAWNHTASARPENVGEIDSGVVLVGDDAIVVIDPADGSTIETFDDLADGSLARTHASAIPISRGGSVELLGEGISIPIGLGTHDYLIVDDNRVYVAQSDAVLAAHTDDILWERSLEPNRRGRPLFGWIDGERFGLVNASGTLMTFQRTDQGRPLIW